MYSRLLAMNAYSFHKKRNVEDMRFKARSIGDALTIL